MALAPDIVADPDPDPRSQPPPSSAPRSNQGFLWKNFFSDCSVSPSPPASTTYLEDGTPVILAPASVLLKSGEAWSRYLVRHFFGEAPSSAKIFSDLNPVWGKNGTISVRRFSNGSCLIHVPSVSTRKWILENGLWSSGMVSFAVSEWSSVPSLAPKKLTSASTILTFREVPPQLWSQVGIETIAGGVAKLIPNVKASLPLSSLGTATIRAIVPLGTVLPSTVIIKDSQDATVRIHVSYGRLPPLCPTCQTFGHQSHCCPSRRAKPIIPPLAIPIIPSTVVNLPEQTSTSPSSASTDLQCDAEMSLDPSPCQSSLSCHLKPPNAQSGLEESPPESTSMDLDDRKSPDSQTIKIISHTTAMSAPGPSSIIMASQVPSSSAQSIDQAPSSDKSLTQHPPSLESIGASSPVVDEKSAMEKHLVTLNDDDKGMKSPSEGDNLVPFSFPPSANHSLDDSGHWVSPIIPSDSSLKAVHTDLHVRKEVVKEKRQRQSPTQISLRCSLDRHKFKPTGVVEKRKRKINQLHLPEEEQIHEAFQEMKEDKANTCLYEIIETFKLMQDQNSESKDNSQKLTT